MDEELTSTNASVNIPDGKKHRLLLFVDRSEIEFLLQDLLQRAYRMHSCSMVPGTRIVISLQRSKASQFVILHNIVTGFSSFRRVLDIAELNEQLCRCRHSTMTNEYVYLGHDHRASIRVIDEDLLRIFITSIKCNSTKFETFESHDIDINRTWNNENTIKTIK